MGGLPNALCVLEESIYLHLPLHRRVVPIPLLLVYCALQGIGECSQCPTGQVQPDKGQVSCDDCALEGNIKTNNQEHTACIDNDELLSSFSIVNIIYSNGTVWVGALMIASLFVVGAAILTYFREKEPALLANFSR